MAKPGLVSATLLSILLLGGAPAGAAEVPLRGAGDEPQRRASNRLEALDYVVLPGGTIVIRLEFRRELRAPPARWVQHYPVARIVYDFTDTVSALGKDPLPVNRRGLRSLHVVRAGNTTRLMIDLARAFIHESALEGRTMLITLDAAAPAATDAAHGELRNIEFQHGPAGEGRIIAEHSGRAPALDIRRVGTVLQVDFHDTALPPRLARRLDVQDFGTAIRTVEAYPIKGGARMAIELAAGADYTVYQTTGRLVVSR